MYKPEILSQQKAIRAIQGAKVWVDLADSDPNNPTRESETAYQADE